MMHMLHDEKLALSSDQWTGYTQLYSEASLVGLLIFRSYVCQPTKIRRTWNWTEGSLWQKLIRRTSQDQCTIEII